MGRLIDADALIDKAKELHVDDFMLVFGMVKNQPTAYSVEKVVAELEEQKTRYKYIRKNTYCRRTEMDDCDSCKADHYLDARLEGIDKAIDIVRGVVK